MWSRNHVSRRTALAALAGFSAGALEARPGAQPRVAVFRSEVTPGHGEPLIWTTPTEKVEDALWAKGIVLEDAGTRYVLCAVDWCGMANSTHLLFRTRIAEAAGTPVERVVVQTVHQHTAPYIDGDAYALLDKLPHPPLRMSGAFLERITERLADAVRKATANLQPFDRVGTGEARVERVASARRIPGPDGRVLIRFSTSGVDPKMAALAEGAIDPMLKTVTLAVGDKPLVRLHYYATHPQTFCCDGRVSGDIVNTAREAVETGEGVFQVYFTGCAGDVTVGKYNDKTPQAQSGLARRLEAGMRASIASTHFAPAGAIAWRAAGVRFPQTPAQPVRDEDDLARLAAGAKTSPDAVYQAAIRLAYARRRRDFEITALSLGELRILHLPGEPMLEFQKYAQGLRPRGFVAVAGYGDISSGYLCTDRAWEEGGYEPSASSAGPGTEAVLKNAIRELLK